MPGKVDLGRGAGGGGGMGAMPRGYVRTAARVAAKGRKRGAKTGSKETLASSTPYGNQQAKAATKAGVVPKGAYASKSVAARQPKFPTKPSAKRASGRRKSR